MKNIHLIPTLQFSKLAYYQESTSYNKPILQLVNMTSSDYTYQHLYITNDEEIKKDDCFEFDGLICQYDGTYKLISGREKKIILTTDLELQKEGIQAIDDEFLQWFINNSSCEEVKIEKVKIINYSFPRDVYNKYKIIIPTNESKQDRTCNNNCSVVCGECQIFNSKQEILEEVLSQKVQELTNCNLHGLDKQSFEIGYSNGFVNGADWQAKKSYSEEDLIQLLNFVSKEYNISNGIGYFHTHESFEDVSSKEVVQKWFETLKKNNL